MQFPVIFLKIIKCTNPKLKPLIFYWFLDFFVIGATIRQTYVILNGVLTLSHTRLLRGSSGSDPIATPSQSSHGAYQTPLLSVNPERLSGVPYAGFNSIN